MAGYDLCCRVGGSDSGIFKLLLQRFTCAGGCNRKLSSISPIRRLESQQSSTGTALERSNVGKKLCCHMRSRPVCTQQQGWGNSPLYHTTHVYLLK